jgi:hypothetical protein
MKKTVSAAKLQKIIRELSTSSAASVARKYRVPYKWTLSLKLTHSVKPAPQPDTCVAVIEAARKRCPELEKTGFFARRISQDADTAFVAGLLHAADTDDTTDVTLSLQAREQFAFNLVRALDCVRRSATAAWKN